MGQKLSLISILLFHGWIVAASLDPFGSADPVWIAEVKQIKPLQLEILFGERSEEHNDLLQYLSAASPQHLSGRVTIPDASLTSLNQIQIAVMPEDGGALVFKSEANDIDLSYQLTQIDDGLELKIALKAVNWLQSEVNEPISATRAFVTSIHLPIGNQWTLLGGLTSETIQSTAENQVGKAEQRFFITAVRIRTNPKGPLK